MSLEGLLPDLDVIRKDFPILERTVSGGKNLVYLDSANTSQKPQIVIDTMVDHLERHNANIARAMHALGAESTEAFEHGRDRVAAFLNAPSRDEVIFTKNASEALNLVANTLALRGPLQVGEGDEILITEMEHHSNIVPWQMLAERTGATLRWFGLTDDGRLDLSNVDELVNERTKVVSFTWVSNMLGRSTRSPSSRRRRRPSVPSSSSTPPRLLRSSRSTCRRAVPTSWPSPATRSSARRASGAVGSARGARRPAALPGWWRDDRDGLDGQVDLRPDPAQVRGRYAAIVEAVGLGAAVDYLAAVGMEAIHRHEQAITRYALEGLATVPGLTVLGPLDAESRRRDLVRDRRRPPARRGQVLDTRGIAVRAGHHCAKPAHARFGVQSSTRMSSYLYTTPAEIDALVEGLNYTRSYFKVG
nr:aminotransferase class V-fold PLP-dependent enzyme [Nocardioides daphniae]